MKKVLAIIAVAIMAVAIPVLAVDAWDYTMSDSEVIYYLKKYPDNKNLKKIAKDKGIDVENIDFETWEWEH